MRVGGKRVAKRGFNASSEFYQSQLTKLEWLSRCRQIMEDTRGVLNMLGSGHICRTKRNANFDAHRLAKIVVK